LHSYRSILAATAAAILFWSGTARAQGLENARSVTLALGTGLTLSGNVINEGVGRINGTPSVFVEQSYANHFSDALRVRLMGNFGLDFNKEAFATFAYNKMNATERVTGSSGGYPLYTRFGNTSALDIEGGLRYYFKPEGPTRTYVAGVGGIRFLEDLQATMRVLELGLTLTDLQYFERSTVLLVGADTGVSRDLSDTIAIGAEVGLRFQPKPSPAPILTGTGLENINDTGSRWSLPISAFMTWRF
jgi:hypothetical protein